MTAPTMGRPRVASSLSILVLAFSGAGAWDTENVVTVGPRVTATLGSSRSYLWIVFFMTVGTAAGTALARPLANRVPLERLLMVGAATFFVLVAASACAMTAGEFVLTRALVGVASGIMTTLPVLLARTITDGRSRALLYGLNSVVWGFSATVVPLIAGGLIALFDWRVALLAPLVLLGPTVVSIRRALRIDDTGTSQLQLTRDPNRVLDPFGYTVLLGAAASLGVLAVLLSSSVLPHPLTLAGVIAAFLVCLGGYAVGLSGRVGAPVPRSFAHHRAVVVLMCAGVVPFAVTWGLQAELVVLFTRGLHSSLFVASVAVSTLGAGWFLGTLLGTRLAAAGKARAAVAGGLVAGALADLLLAFALHSPEIPSAVVLVGLLAAAEGVANVAVMQIAGILEAGLDAGQRGPGYLVSPYVIVRGLATALGASVAGLAMFRGSSGIDAAATAHLLEGASVFLALCAVAGAISSAMGARRLPADSVAMSA